MLLYKYHGLGNDYLVYHRAFNPEPMTKELAFRLCSRHVGLGADGVLEGLEPERTDSASMDEPERTDSIPADEPEQIHGMCAQTAQEGFGLRIWNPDGSQAEKSGNGIRIYARFLKDAGFAAGESILIHVSGGLVPVTCLDARGDMLRVYMGKLSFDSADVGVSGARREVIGEPFRFGDRTLVCTCVSIGNPHCVIRQPRVSRSLVEEIGRRTECAPCFQNRINTQIVQEMDRSNIRIEIYERGAGYTYASGSSACAAAGAMYRMGYVDSQVRVHMPGGYLDVEIGKNQQVWLTGPVSFVYRAENLTL